MKKKENNNMLEKKTFISVQSYIISIILFLK